MTNDETEDKTELTRIDLGDDLIETTAIIPGQLSTREAAAAASPPEPPNVEDQIQNARILLNEGFPEEAKKVLRQILLADESRLEARKLLEEIHEAELKQMFGTAEPAVRKSFLASYDDSILHADSEEIIRILDRDIGLGLDNPAQELSFFSDLRLLNQFSDRIDREIGDSISDRIDLAVGFMEMGLYTVTIRLLQTLLVCDDESQRLNATALVAYAHLQNSEPYRTIAALQSVLNDSEIERGQKTECFYLTGRAQQAIGKYTDAISWYFQAQENEQNYRDTTDRIVRCKTMLTRK